MNIFHLFSKGKDTALRAPQPPATQQHVHAQIMQARDELCADIAQEFKHEQQRLRELKASVLNRLKAHHQWATQLRGHEATDSIIPSITDSQSTIKVLLQQQDSETISGDDLAFARELFEQWQATGQRDQDTTQLLQKATALDDKGRASINKLKEIASTQFEHAILQTMSQHIKDTLFVQSSKLQVRVYQRVESDEKEMQQISLNFSSLSVEQSND